LRTNLKGIRDCKARPIALPSPAPRVTVSRYIAVVFLIVGGSFIKPSNGTVEQWIGFLQPGSRACLGKPEDRWVVFKQHAAYKSGDIFGKIGAAIATSRLLFIYNFFAMPPSNIYAVGIIRLDYAG